MAFLVQTLGTGGTHLRSSFGGAPGFPHATLGWGGVGGNPMSVSGVFAASPIDIRPLRGLGAGRGCARQVLFFTESHCGGGQKHVLGSFAAGVLRPCDWAGDCRAGFRARSATNRLSVAEGRLYDADIRLWDEWAYLAQACFAQCVQVTEFAGAYQGDAAGCEQELGTLLTEWVLCGALRPRGADSQGIGYLPEGRARESLCVCPGENSAKFEDLHARFSSPGRDSPIFSAARGAGRRRTPVVETCSPVTINRNVNVLPGDNFDPRHGAVARNS